MENAVTTQVAAYAAARSISELPELVRCEALRSISNIPGDTLGGATHEGVEWIRKERPPL